VVGLGIALTVAAKAVFSQVSHGNTGLASFGGIFGTAISGAFLYLIAILNLVILISISKIFISMRRGLYDEDELEEQLQARGLMFRIFGKMMKSISEPWHMYIVGLLFGLGFDTATEIALLAATAGAAESRLPWYAVLALPILFTAGMSLLDTIDGSFMNFAYGWAFARPVRKVYYNITITGLSVAVAMIIGTIEILGLVANEAHLQGGFWRQMATFNINIAGMIIAGMFLFVWVAALVIWRYGRIEHRWDQAAMKARHERAQNERAQLDDEVSVVHS
jgi:high-affinity nickel-transport protein